MISQDPELSGEMDGGNQLQGERALLAAVIQQALYDVLVRPSFRPVNVITPTVAKYRKKMMSDWSHERDKALSWLLDESVDDKTTLMSLEWICEMLGLNARLIRHRLRVTLGRTIDPMTRPYAFAK